MSSAIAITHPALSGYYDYEPASDSSRAIWHKWLAERNYLEGSASDWVPTVDAILSRIARECATENWDGQGAFAITDRVIANAQKVIDALFSLLPKGMPTPDVSPESDGEICITWSIDASKIFSLSVGEQQKINFAGQFGREGEVHAWQPIATSSRCALEESLQDVARYLERLYPPALSERAA